LGMEEDCIVGQGRQWNVVLEKAKNISRSSTVVVLPIQECMNFPDLFNNPLFYYTNIEVWHLSEFWDSSVLFVSSQPTSLRTSLAHHSPVTKTEETTGGCRKLCNELHDLYLLPNVTRVKY
jgi:hypothetical protein